MRAFDVPGFAVALLAARAVAGTLSVLTFNVAGLPSVINSNDETGDKETNTATIGQDFAKYAFDIIHVQEDFHYHDILYGNDNHTYRTVTSGDIVAGSGLNTLANYPWTNLTRVTWSQCYINDGDCLTPKGFTYMRMMIDSDIYVDVYNLHSDAGSQDGDQVARHSNTQQVADFISQNSEGYAVIVAGDTNSRYTRTADGIRTFITQNGLTDAWVELEKGGVAPAAGSAALVCDNPSNNTDCEIVDKVFYRSGDNVQLYATSFEYAGDNFLQPNGSTLSDHNPVLVQLEWEPGCECC